MVEMISGIGEGKAHKVCVDNQYDVKNIHTYENNIYKTINQIHVYIYQHNSASIFSGKKPTMDGSGFESKCNSMEKIWIR